MPGASAWGRPQGGKTQGKKGQEVDMSSVASLLSLMARANVRSHEGKRWDNCLGLNQMPADLEDCKQFTGAFESVLQQEKGAVLSMTCCKLLQSTEADFDKLQSTIDKYKALDRSGIKGTAREVLSPNSTMGDIQRAFRRLGKSWELYKDARVLVEVGPAAQHIMLRMDKHGAAETLQSNGYAAESGGAAWLWGPVADGGANIVQLSPVEHSGVLPEGGTLELPPGGHLLLQGEGSAPLTLRGVAVKGDGTSVLHCVGNVCLEDVEMEGCSVVADAGATLTMRACSVQAAQVGIVASGSGTSALLVNCRLLRCEQAAIAAAGAKVTMKDTHCSSSRGAVVEARGMLTVLTLVGGTAAGPGNTAGEEGAEVACVYVHGVGRVVAQGCRLEGGRIGMVAEGPGTTLAAHGCTASELCGRGFVVRDYADAELKQCEAEGCGGAGVEVSTGAAAVLHSCLFEGSREGCGVLVQGEDTNVFVRQCEMLRNALSGVNVTSGASATLHSCKLFGSRSGHGLQVWGEGSDAEATECIMSGNCLSGALVTKGATVELAGCRLEDNRQYEGAAVEEGSRLSLYNNLFDLSLPMPGPDFNLALPNSIFTFPHFQSTASDCSSPSLSGMQQRP